MGFQIPPMSKLSLSPHLDARYGNTHNEILFSNLSYGTRILAVDGGWDRLAQAQDGSLTPQTDPWVARAHGAMLFATDAKSEVPDFVLRLDNSMKNCVEQATGHRPETSCDKVGLLSLLEQTEAIYRERHMPKPLTGQHQVPGPFLREPHRLVDYIFDHTRAFLNHDLEPAPPEELDFELVKMFFDRPAMKHRYEQQFCIPLTTQQRARKIIESTKPGGRVLVLGDDDLVSLALVHMTDKLQVDVLELDEDLVEFLHDKGGDRLTVLEHNLRYGVPDSMKHAYDCVTTDPPYAEDGMRFFLGCARDSMVMSPESRLFLTTYPGLLESPKAFYHDVGSVGLEILHTHEHFSRYIYNNLYRVSQLTALRHMGAPMHPTAELIGYPFLYAHFFECAHRPGAAE